MITKVKYSLQVTMRERETRKFIGSLPFVRIINVPNGLDTWDLVNNEKDNILKTVILDYLKAKGIDNSIVELETKGNIEVID